MKVVSGLRRSGTSMLMYALKEAGNKVAGYKWASKGHTTEHEEANPNGYWEVGKVTSVEGLTRKAMLVEQMGDIVKVMFDVLAMSYPPMIDKVLVIMRKPKCVIDSFVKHNVIEHQGVFVLNYCLDVIDSFEYLEAHQKDYRVVFYEEIIKNPSEEMKKICEFMGGDYKKAAKAVNPKLNRSKGINYKYIEYLEDTYKFAKQGKINKIINMKTRVEILAHKELEAI